MGGGQTGHHHPKPKLHTNFTFNGIHIITYLFCLLIYSVCLEQFGSPGRWQGAFARLRPASIMFFLVEGSLFFCHIAWHIFFALTDSMTDSPLLSIKTTIKPPYLVTTKLLHCKWPCQGLQPLHLPRGRPFRGEHPAIFSTGNREHFRWYPLVMTNIAMV